MSALASATEVAHSNHFSAHLALAAGVHVSISAPTLADLSQVVGKLQPTAAANEGNVQHRPASRAPAAATAPAGKPATQTTEPSAPAAAAPAAQGEAGNATPAGQAAAASTASSTKPEGEAGVTFDQLKKAFLGLSTKTDGRAKCEKVLASFEPKLGRLSDAKPEQYAAVLAEIQKASA